MDQIFAPWRIEWVERDGDGDIDGCPFCVLPERQADRDSRIVARSPHCFVLLNNYPYNPGHVMVIPHTHAGDYAELDETTLLDHAKLKARTLRALRDGLGPDGFNTGMNLGDAAGGSIDDHVHEHVVPRWSGDTNYMPVVGETKVIVEALEETYERLQEAFASQSGAAPAGETTAVRFD